MNDGESAQLPKSSITLFEFLDSEVIRKLSTGESIFEALSRLVHVENVEFFRRSGDSASINVTALVARWADLCVELQRRIDARADEEIRSRSTDRRLKRAAFRIAFRLSLDLQHVSIDSHTLRRARVALYDSNASLWPSHEQLKTSAHRIVARAARDARNDRQALYEEAENEAERRLRDGDERNHALMARLLLDLNEPSTHPGASRPKYPGLSPATLRKRISDRYRALGRPDLISGTTEYGNRRKRVE
jgi:hypothetical protein